MQKTKNTILQENSSTNIPKNSDLLFLQVNCENSPRVFLPGHNKFLYLKIGGAILAHSSRWSNNNTLRLVDLMKTFCYYTGTILTQIDVMDKSHMQN